MNQILLWYFIAGVLGVSLQTLLKISSLKMRAKNANHVFSIKGYFADDYPTILASVVSVLILIVCIDELLGVRPALAEYIKWLFVFVGFTGSSLIQSVMSVTNKKIMAIIDVKSNIADGIEPAVNPSNMEAVKEIKKGEAAVQEIKDNQETI